MESLLKDLPSRDSGNFSHYNQSSYKYAEPKSYIKLKDHTKSDQAQVIVMDKQSILRCELERKQNPQRRKKAIKRVSNESDSNRRSKLRKTDSEDSSDSENERECD